MTTRNGAAERIVAFVAAHPGCTRAELLRGLDVEDEHWAMPTYCVKTGLIFAAGPRGSRQFFPTAELAQARHAAIVEAVLERRQAKKRAAWKKGNERLKAERKAMRPEVVRRIKARNDVLRRAKKALGKGVKVARDVRITIAAPMRDRWAA